MLLVSSKHCEVEVERYLPVYFPSSNRLEQNGEYERAAATALFNNQMRLAINILSGRNTREVKSDNGPRPSHGKNSLNFFSQKGFM